LYICNVDENSIMNGNMLSKKVTKIAENELNECVTISASIESQLAEFKEENEKILMLKDFGLNERRSKMLSKDALILHPGPKNQGVEITAEVSTDPRSIILDQVTNGVSLRMAVLFMLLGQHEMSQQSEL